MKCRHLLLISPVLLVTGYGSPVAADEDVPRIVVTATRTEQPIEDVNASVEVIDREEIESYSGNSVTEVLKYATGVEVMERGNETQISVRGMSSGQTLILVDGLRRTDKASGSVITNIQVEDIERIEIVRGPMSALYGSEAMGGVINIITAKPQEGTRSGMDLTVGQTDDGQRETGIAGGFINWGGDTTGHRVSFESRSRGDFRTDPESIETDMREEERNNLAYRGRYALNDADELTWGAEYAEQDDEGVGYDAKQDIELARIETEERYHLTAGYDGLVGSGIAALNVGHGVADSTSQKSATDWDDTTSTKDEAQAQYTFWPHAAHTFNVGYGFLGESFDSTAIGGEETRDVHSVFLQDQWMLTNEVGLTVGARQDDYSDFGSATSPNVTLAWRPGPWTLRAGYGEAFRAPTMMELYADLLLQKKTRVGNPDLDAETSRSVEMAVARSFRRGNVELALYQTDADDLIQSYDVLKTYPTTPRGEVVDEWIESYTNINSARIRGAELTWNVRPATFWWMDGSMEYVDAEDADTHESLTGRAERTVKVTGNLRTGAAIWRLRGKYIDDYLHSGDNADEPYYSDFATVDLRLDYRLAASHTLFMGVDNILDRDVPDNMVSHGATSDPGVRYVYAGYRGRF